MKPKEGMYYYATGASGRRSWAQFGQHKDDVAALESFAAQAKRTYVIDGHDWTPALRPTRLGVFRGGCIEILVDTITV